MRTVSQRHPARPARSSTGSSTGSRASRRARAGLAVVAAASCATLVVAVGTPALAGTGGSREAAVHAVRRYKAAQALKATRTARARAITPRRDVSSEELASQLRELPEGWALQGRMHDGSQAGDFTAQRVNDSVFMAEGSLHAGPGSPAEILRTYRPDPRDVIARLAQANEWRGAGVKRFDLIRAVELPPGKGFSGGR
jgi:hypothetical protein